MQYRICNVGYGEGIMRIELSDPIPGLLIALPLITILMTAGRSPMVVRQRPSQQSERAIRATQLARPCEPYHDRYDLGALAGRWDEERYRPHAVAFVRAGRRWRNRPEAAIDCEVFVSCQQMTAMR
jgi:hypothetical protein